MQKRMTNIRVFDKDIVFVGEVSNFASLMFTSRFQNAGEFEIHLNKPNLQLFQNGFYIMINNDPYMTGVIEYEFDNGDAYIIDQSKEFVVKGYSLAGLFMRRITDPDGTKDGYLRWSNRPAEDVMTELVKSQTTQAVDTKRRPARFEVAASSHRGGNITFESRFKNLLEELNTLAVKSGLGFAIKLDAPNRKLIFEVLQGVNRIYNTNNSQSFIFSKSFGRVTAQSYEHSTMGTSNYAYVLGQGDGTSRTQVITGETATTGWERREIYVDARDIADESEEEGYNAEATLKARGDEKLNEVKEVANYDFLANPSEYREKWNLGDACTYRGEEQGVLMEAQITEVEETWEGAVHTVEPVFGNRTTTIKGSVSIAQTGAGIERVGVDKTFTNIETTQSGMADNISTIEETQSGMADNISTIEQTQSGMADDISDLERAQAGMARDINRAQQSADGKNTIFYDETMPDSGIAPGDVWFAPNQGYKMYRWTGYTWLAEEFGNEAIADASITNAKIANATISDAKISTVDVGKLTAHNASINELSAIAANLGTITAGTINGVTINGTTINSSNLNVSTTSETEQGIWFKNGTQVFGSIQAVDYIDAETGQLKNTMELTSEGINIITDECRFTTIPYVRGVPFPLFVGGSKTITPNGTSYPIITSNEITVLLQQKSGLNIIASNANLVVIANNGHGNANAAHIEGVTYMEGGSWYAVFDRTVTTTMRVNWVALYLGLDFQ